MGGGKGGLSQKNAWKRVSLRTIPVLTNGICEYINLDHHFELGATLPVSSLATVAGRPTEAR